jgi:hypothetical protein
MIPNHSFLAGSTAGDVFRPWRSEFAYSTLLIVLTGILFVVCRLESDQILESQIALGIDPGEVAKFVSLAILVEMLNLVFLAVRARRSLLATGELRFVGSSLTLSRGLSSQFKNLDDLSRVSCQASGSNVRMQFPEETIRLPGQWLPPGWRRTWRGWRTPEGEAVRLRRKTHPLLAALHLRRPELKPRFAGIGVEVLVGVLCAVAPRIGSYPLYAEARRLAARQNVDDVAMKDFQDGKYLQACEAYRRALPGLNHDLYGSQHAAEFLLYCGDARAAVKAFLGYDVQPLWPFPLDPVALARIRLFSGRYAQAESLLGHMPSYQLYLAIIGQGRQAEADHILEGLAGKDGLARVLLLRHQGRAEAQDAAGVLCSSYLTHKPATPSWLARVFESCILAGGARKVTEDHRFGPAVVALPGLRDELVQFTDREAPESAREVKAAVGQIVSRLDNSRARISGVGPITGGPR